MIALGIDPGTVRIGYGIIEKTDSKLRLVAAGLLPLGSKNAPRLAAIKRGVDALIKTHHPEILAVEKLYFSKNQKTAIAVAQARGAILLAAEERSIPIRELDPGVVKAGITGYGRSDKKAVAKMVGLFLKEDLRVVDDVTDALAMAIVAASREVTVGRQ